MADKFIRHGATFNGDGTTSAAAASDGGVGAWNNINVFEGTTPAYGSLGAGDVVYIRSKDEGGANITRTTAANITLGSAAGSSAAYVRWVIDDGSVWAGISGTITYNCTSTFTITTRVNNEIRAIVQGALKIAEQSTTSNKRTFTQVGGVTQNIEVDLSAATSGYGAHMALGSGALMKSPVIKSAVRGSTGLVITNDGNQTSMLVDPQIELLNPGTVNPAFGNALSNGQIRVVGGRIFGVGAATGVAVANVSLGSVILEGTIFPNEMKLVLNALTGSSFFTALNPDSTNGSVVAYPWGEADSRQDGNYPTLNATLPDSAATPWSWKLYPTGAKEQRAASVKVGAVYQDVDQIIEGTVEILVGATFSAIDASTLWLDIVYIDATTGLPKFFSTQAVSASALDSSTAGWSSDSYGPFAFDKRKITFTTPTSVRQDSMVLVDLRCSAQATTASHLIFLCPDIRFSTP